MKLKRDYNVTKFVRIVKNLRPKVGHIQSYVDKDFVRRISSVESLHIDNLLYVIQNLNILLLICNN